MFNYSIMGLFDDHVEEICEDILEQRHTGVADMALFMMTLVPEGDPPIDKASILCEKYDKYRKYLASRGEECGILVQASIGHGYPLNRMFPFRPMVNLTDGKELTVVCPYDEEFREFFRGQFRTLAQHKPALIMLDDDFRLLGREGKGCACPRHMAEFNRRAGTDLTREELFAVLKQDSEEALRLNRIFLDVQRDSLVGAAKAFRDGIDEVDPSIPGVYCCVAGEFEAEIARVMAGEGHPVIVRINNGNYTPAGARRLSDAMLRAAYQIHTAAEPVDAFLAETDTCPQNRYSTGAMSLHAHFTGTILEGASGAKHWITRLSAYEPASGRAYRRQLAKNTGFYHALAELTPTLQPLGCRIPLPSRWTYDFTGNFALKVPNGFSGCVLERLGLPLYFSEKPGGAVFMDNEADRNFTDAEIETLLEGPVFLDAQTAKHLIARGFGSRLGVDVRPWNGPRMTGELLPNGNICNAQVRGQELVMTSPHTRADSMVYHVHDGKTKTFLFPGVTVFQGPQGGPVTVFCGDPQTDFNYMDAFAYLTESRKAQLIGLLKAAGTLPVYAAGDEEIYLRAAAMEDGGLFLAVFNLGLDPMDEIALVTEKKYTRAQRLMPDGSKVTCPLSAARYQEGMFSFSALCPAYTLDPVILFLYE